MLQIRSEWLSFHHISCLLWKDVTLGVNMIIRTEAWNALWVKASEIAKVKERSSHRAHIPPAWLKASHVPTPMVPNLNCVLKLPEELLRLGCPDYLRVSKPESLRVGPKCQCCIIFNKFPRCPQCFTRLRTSGLAIFGEVWFLHLHCPAAGKCLRLSCTELVDQNSQVVNVYFFPK